jgi:diadenosine tetraphosphate (Ap4A) HIT family hydrolase
MWKFFLREQWHKIKPDDLWEKDCPFCDMESEKEDLIIWQWRYFHIRHNKYPYLWLKNHLLVIPYRHIKYSRELNKKELTDLRNVEVFMKNYYKDWDYFSFLRETSWAKSLNHLHYHFLPWKIIDKDIEFMLKKQWY